MARYIRSFLCPSKSGADISSTGIVLNVVPASVDLPDLPAASLLPAHLLIKLEHNNSIQSTPRLWPNSARRRRQLPSRAPELRASEERERLMLTDSLLLGTLLPDRLWTPTARRFRLGGFRLIGELFSSSSSSRREILTFARRRHPPQPMGGNFNRGPPPPQPQHAAYSGQNQGYSSFPAANMAAAQCEFPLLVTLLCGPLPDRCSSLCRWWLRSAAAATAGWLPWSSLRSTTAAAAATIPAPRLVAIHSRLRSSDSTHSPRADPLSLPFTRLFGPFLPSFLPSFLEVMLTGSLTPKN
jgi:hypothetical protein